MRSVSTSSFLIVATSFLSVAALSALDVDTKFHDAPESAQKMKNPYEGNAAAAQAGKALYAKNCLSCHGKMGKGTGNIPSLVNGKLESVKPGEVFWFVTKGDKDNGMPSWAFLPERQRWQIVSYVTAVLPTLKAGAAGSSPVATDTSTSKF